MDYAKESSIERQIEMRKFIPGQNYDETTLEHLRKVDFGLEMTKQQKEHYARFLTIQERDLFLQVPKLDKNSISYLEAQVELQRAEVKILWLRNRFTKFYSKKWMQNKSLYYTAHSYLRLLEGALEQKVTGKYSLQEPNRV
jgi:hypothetical protein